MLSSEQVGTYCGKVLHWPKAVNSDSVKIAGLLDILHVQGRWGPAGRLAYQRCCSSPYDVIGTKYFQNKDRRSGNPAPGPHVWKLWETAFETVWVQHADEIIIPEPHPSDAGSFR